MFNPVFYSSRNAKYLTARYLLIYREEHLGSFQDEKVFCVDNIFAMSIMFKKVHSITNCLKGL